MADLTEKQKEIDLKFSVLTMRLYLGGASVKALMTMMYSGLIYSASCAFERAEAFRALVNPTPEQKKEYKLIRLMDDLPSDPAIAGAEAATIIYAHAVLDAIVHGLCRLSANIDARPWAAFFEKKHITLEDAKSSSISELENKLVENYLQQLERESLLQAIS